MMRPLLVVIVALFAACAWDKPNPSAFQPVPGAPCGNLGVDCGNKMCCDEGETCGAAGRSCPAGMCCNIREPPSFLHYGDSGIVGDRDAGPIVIITKPQRQTP